MVRAGKRIAMKSKYLVYFPMIMMLSVFLLDGCKTNSDVMSSNGGQITLLDSNDGKVVERDKGTFRFGDYLFDPGEKSIWKKEIIGTKEIEPTYEKWGMPVSGVNGNFQVMRKVRHFQFLDGEVEYVYCRKIIGYDKVSDQIIFMPKQLKKTGKVRNITILKEIDLHTGDASTKKI